MINVVCAVIENSAKEFLVCQRPEGKALAGQWEFPGGKVEPGEAESEALQREIREELGCHAIIGKKLNVVEQGDAESGVRLIPFHCTLEGSPQLLEHADFFWCKSEKFAELDWVAADVSIWENLLGKS